MNNQREKMVSKQAYIQKQMRSMHTGGGISIGGAARIVQEMGRWVSDFGRQALLFAGLFLLVAIILAATTGNRTFAEFVYWSGLYNTN